MQQSLVGYIIWHTASDERWPGQLVFELHTDEQLIVERFPSREIEVLCLRTGWRFASEKWIVFRALQLAEECQLWQDAFSDRRRNSNHRFVDYLIELEMHGYATEQVRMNRIKAPVFR